MFRKNQEGYLVENYALLDSQIIVSSVHSATYPKESIRVIDLISKCGWLKSDSDTSPWVKFDLLQSYTAVGLLVRKRSDQGDGDQHVKTFSLFTSDVAE